MENTNDERPSENWKLEIEEEDKTIREEQMVDKATELEDLKEAHRKEIHNLQKNHALQSKVSLQEKYDAGWELSKSQIRRLKKEVKKQGLDPKKVFADPDLRLNRGHKRKALLDTEEMGDKKRKQG